MSHLETYFSKFKDKIIGEGYYFDGPYGPKRIIYADWTASGRMYKDIEEKFLQDIYPYVANTHTETNITGTMMTVAYQEARNIIKKHVNACPTDVLISSSSGMTGVVNKWQRILGLKVHESHMSQLKLDQSKRPVVFITHMEHHSNQTSWLETLAEVVIMPYCNEGLVDLEGFKHQIEEYKDRPLKIAAVTSCSNVTGIFTPYHEIAKIMHINGGLCFVDFACSAPYIDINMHPTDPLESLDAIYFSPHKFLGGPGSTGILIFDGKLYKNRIPDNPGGGTVDWTNPWGQHKYHDEIEAREDGGTPAFIQTIRVAMAIRLKDEMQVNMIHNREKELLDIVWNTLSNVENVVILAEKHKERLPIFSFYIKEMHYNLVVKILNDTYGIQVRGGCSCAGTYGHYLLEVSQQDSNRVTSMISSGDLTAKPGWVRMSLHPTTTDEEALYMVESIAEIAANREALRKNYTYNPKTNEFDCISDSNDIQGVCKSWFDIPKTQMNATV